MAQSSCLSMQIILDAHFGGTDREMQPPCNQIYSVRHNCQSFPGLSHLAGSFSEIYFTRKCSFIHIGNYIHQKERISFDKFLQS